MADMDFFYNLGFYIDLVKKKWLKNYRIKGLKNKIRNRGVSVNKYVKNPKIRKKARNKQR
jgi:hypothetical protein